MEGGSGSGSGGEGGGDTGSSDAPRGLGAGFWLGIGIASAGVVGGTVLGFLAIDELGKYNATPTEMNPDVGPTVERRDRGETYALLADLSFGAAILAGAVTLVVHFSEQSERPQANAALRTPRLRARLRPTPNGFLLNF